MTATIELSQAKDTISEQLGDKAPEYFRLLKTWFRKQCSKEDFDAEARRLLNPNRCNYHNTFMLAIMHKCQTLLTFNPPSMSGTGRASPSLMHQRQADILARYKYGQVKRNLNPESPSFEYSFVPATDSKGLLPTNPLGKDFREEEERKLGYAFRESTMPDIALLHGRMMVIAWDAELEGGVDDESVSTMANAVEQLLKNLITAILMDRNGYKLRDNKLPIAIGVDCPNPWVINTQRRKPKVEAVSELAKLGALQKFHSNDGGIIPLFPVGQRMDRDVEADALGDIACATSYSGYRFRRPGGVSLEDLFHTIQKNKSLLPSHTVYSLNMERILDRLHHPGHEDLVT